MNKKKKVIKGKIVNNREIVRGLFRMDISSEWMGQNSYAGQFVNVRVADDTTDPLLRVPLGIHRIREDGISLLYKVVGPGTTKLSRRSPDEEIDIVGPLGNGFDISPVTEKENGTALILAGGHGMAPLFALAEAVRKEKKEVEFFIGACTQEEITCVEDLEKEGAKVHVSTDDGTCGMKGRVTDILVEYLKKTENKAGDKTIFACGPLPMIKAVADVAEKAGIKAQVTRDEYMACGIGACRSCAIDTKEGIKLACTDGPVFDAAILKWEK